MAPEIDSLKSALADRYRLEREIGQGGMATVYLAKDVKHERQVALKVLKPELGAAIGADRFLAEIKTTANLRHPHIVPLFDSGVADGLLYYVMPFVEGESLEARVERDGQLPIEEALRLVSEAASALRYAHERGVIHRDIKPANIMIDGGHAVVTDFGLARAMELSSGTRLTQTGTIMGTPSYMSPEQASDPESVDLRSDLYSLACVLYELLAGRPPFEGATPVAVITRHVLEPVPSLSALRADLGPGIAETIERALAKAPDDRFASVEQWIAALARAGDETRRPSAWPDPEPSRDPGGARRTPLVGRDAERATLHARLSDANEGRGGLVLLGGEPGVGKTRLAGEVLEEGARKGMLSLVGHAYEDETAPFITSSEILEEMVRLVPTAELRAMLGDDAAEISRLLPELRQIFPDLPEPTEMPAGLQQRHLFRAVLEFLRRGSAAQPMVMLLDDIHWADESSLQLLEHIAPRLAELPILMLGTYRDVEADIGKPFARSMTTLVRQRLTDRIQIKPFDEAAVADLLSALGGPAPPAELVRAIHDATEGNVFFIEETFRHLSEEGVLFDDDGQWQSAIDIDALDVPEGVRLVTARRLERLTDATRKVLSVAAVIGLRFPIRVLEAAVPDPDAVLDAVEEAEAAQLLHPAVGGRELRYEFVHALARQTILADLSPLRQQRTHLTIADAIEGFGPEQAERHAADIAYHLLGAGGSASETRTIEWLSTAGANASSAAAMEEAVHYFDTALSLIGEERSEQRARLLHGRGSARLSLGHREGFIEDLSEAFESLEELGLGQAAAAVGSEMSFMLIWNGQAGEATAVIERAVDLIGGEHPAARCRLLSARGLALGMGRDPAGAERATESAVELARTLDDPPLLAEVLQNQTLERFWRMDGFTMEQAGHEAASIHRTRNSEWNLGHCLWTEQMGLVWQGRYEEAARIDEELRPLAERNEDVGSLALSAIASSLIHQARGDLAESSRHMRRSIELFEAGGFPWGWISHGHYSVNALLQGEYDDARVSFELAGEHALSDLCWSGADTCYLLSGKARLGDADTRELFDSLRPDLPAQGDPKQGGDLCLLLGAIEAALLDGRDEEAAGLYPAMRDVVTSGIGVGGFTYGLYERFAAMAAAAAGDWEAADAHFEAAIGLARDLPHRVDQARIPYWWGRMLLDRDGERAATLLAEARAVSEEIGMQGLIDQIDDAVAGQATTADGG